MAGCAGGFAWAVVEFYTRPESGGRLSVISFCSGIVAGLVGITPGAGFVPIWSALIIGAATAICSLWSVRLKNWFGYDDNVDAVAVHGVGGIVGTLLAALFASKDVAALDGSNFAGGAFIDGNWIQLAHNIAGSLAILAYAFLGTYVIVAVMDAGTFFRPKSEEIPNTSSFLEEVVDHMSNSSDEDDITLPPTPVPSPLSSTDLSTKLHHFIPRGFDERTVTAMIRTDDV